LWNIDSKVDDGMPGTGVMVVYSGGSECTDAPDNSAASAATAKYKVTSIEKGCSAVFRKQF
jgi:hypothetical protein